MDKKMKKEIKREIQSNLYGEIIGEKRKSISLLIINHQRLENIRKKEKEMK